MSTIVLGIGNILLRDEGIGVRAIDELERRFEFPQDVELVDGGTSGIELLRFFAGHDNLVIIDAIKAGHAPGTTLRMEGEDVPARFRQRITPHQLGLSDLLAAASLTGETPGYMVLFGLEPGSMEFGLELTSDVAAGFDKLISSVVDELRKLGHDVREREVALAHKTTWQELEENV